MNSNQKFNTLFANVQHQNYMPEIWLEARGVNLVRLFKLVRKDKHFEITGYPEPETQGKGMLTFRLKEVEEWVNKLLNLLRHHFPDRRKVSFGISI